MQTKGFPKTVTPQTQQDVEPIIKEAMKKTKVLKETDLAHYIPSGDTHLSQKSFIETKESDKNSFIKLLKTHILDKNPEKIPSSTPPFSSSALSQPSNVLEIILKKAMQKVNVHEETKLCHYILYKDRRLHHHTFNQLKKNDPAKLSNLITNYILSKNPKQLMRKNKRQIPQGEISLDQTIAKAMKRRNLKLKKEKDLCLYLPNGGSRMHPLAFRSMKEKNPDYLKDLIEQYVLQPKKPKILEWKKRVKSLENGQPNEIENTKLQESPQIAQILEAIQESSQLTKQLLEALQNSNHTPSLNTPIHEEFLEPFNNLPRENSPVSRFERYFKNIQNQLISQIRQRKVDYDLWNKFAELVENVYDSF